ncbi:MAG: hypothetical protein Tsb0010_08190 [Parvularculaceae bacterium]
MFLRVIPGSTPGLTLALAIALAACGQDSAQSGAEANAGSSMRADADTSQDADRPDAYEAGERLFRQRCLVCHTVAQGAPNRVGPNLWGVFGAEAGTRAGFAYSPAMAESGIVWDAETLAAYLENPRTFIPRNRMAFAGLPDRRDREAIIAYLRVATGEGE